MPQATAIRRVFLVSLVIVALQVVPACSWAGPAASEPVPTQIRVATFNIRELGREKLDRVDPQGRYSDPQLLNAAEIIQRIRPDILLVNEIDFDEGPRENARLFVDRFLKVPRGGREAIDYPHVFFEPSNTGLPSGRDLDNNGKTDDPADAFGFGRYPGQYGMALLSRFPIDREAARTFQNLSWDAMPNHLIPDGRGGRPSWYDRETKAVLRLSSKSHWDVPVRVGGKTLHVLASHPTPPVFDGEEDRNGRRNFDEIRFWADYIGDAEGASYIVDDAGRRGGLNSEALFVIVGDLNADPENKTPYGGSAISNLLQSTRVRDPRPVAEGGLDVKRSYAGDPRVRTAAYGRLDYVLPSDDLEVVSSAIYWPRRGSPQGSLMWGPQRASDHALVWVDLRL